MLIYWNFSIYYSLLYKIYREESGRM